MNILFYEFIDKVKGIYVFILFLNLDLFLKDRYMLCMFLLELFLWILLDVLLSRDGGVILMFLSFFICIINNIELKSVVNLEYG